MIHERNAVPALKSPDTRGQGDKSPAGLKPLSDTHHTIGHAPLSHRIPALSPNNHNNLSNVNRFYPRPSLLKSSNNFHQDPMQTFSPRIPLGSPRLAKLSSYVTSPHKFSFLSQIINHDPAQNPKRTVLPEVKVANGRK